MTALRWPLVAPAALSFDPWRAGRVCVYDLGARIGVEQIERAPADAAMLVAALRAVPAGDLRDVLATLDEMGAAATVVGILVGAVLRAEGERLSHAFCCAVGPRTLAPSLALRGIVTVRAGVA